MTVQLPNFSFRKRAKARRAVGTSAKAVMFHSSGNESGLPEQLEYKPTASG